MVPEKSGLSPACILTMAAPFGLLALLTLHAWAQDGGSNTHPSPPAAILDSYPSPLPRVHPIFSTAKPLVKQLPRFSATNVPESGPEELPVSPLVAEGTVPAGLPHKGASQRPMLYIGEGYNKMYLINHGKTQWTYSTGGGNEYDDVWMLSNGNVLFTRMYYIVEITPSKQIVWRYDAPRGTEIHTCQPIGFDKVMFVLNGLPGPRLLIVNIHTKAVEVDRQLPSPSATDVKSVHPQFRRVRITAQGTYLASFLTMGRVVEYDKDFKEIWHYDIPHPWAAIRLKNGNTLITSRAGRPPTRGKSQGRDRLGAHQGRHPAAVLVRQRAIRHPPRQRQYHRLLAWRSSSGSSTGRSNARQKGRLGYARLGSIRPRHRSPDTR